MDITTTNKENKIYPSWTIIEIPTEEKVESCSLPIVDKKLLLKTIKEIKEDKKLKKGEKRAKRELTNYVALFLMSPIKELKIETITPNETLLEVQDCLLKQNHFNGIIILTTGKLAVYIKKARNKVKN